MSAAAAAAAAASRATGVAISNPLVLYRSLLATGALVPDAAQHRLALHLQVLYERLKDYEPIVEYGDRLDQISRSLRGGPDGGPGRNGTPPSSSPQGGVLAALFEGKKKDDLALTRIFTTHEEAVEMKSPRGLMLHGEVGTGKSMLIDMFADSLPNRKKRRWHFTTFMLEVMSKLEHLRRSRQTVIPAALGRQDDYSLLWLARDMISTSPILFLDEFQLPDRAASKIVTNLMTYFFHLGGVLIATSNRMPEELAKATGMEFAAPAPLSRMQSLGQRLGMGARLQRGRSDAMYGGATGDFARFLDVLKARCDVWQMEGGKDYRRRESQGEVLRTTNERSVDIEQEQEQESAVFGGLGQAQQSRHLENDPSQGSGNVLPKFFHLSLPDEAAAGNTTQQAILQAFPPPAPNPVPWTPSFLRVYGRQVPVPRQFDGACHFTFAELCCSNLGPADYVSLASAFHTVLLTDVPVLTLFQKNDARRFITLLDALYEARCKLLITAAAGPDDLFFPETNKTSSPDEEETVDQDAIMSETLSDIYQDATAPFRPNISSYDPGISTPVEPDFTHARLAGFLSDDQLEDAPPNRPHRSQPSSPDGAARGDSIYGLDTAEAESLDSLRSRLAQQRAGPNFRDAGVFTGEDEKFAYKRARSRLWEMCGQKWWSRDDPDLGWWRPLHSDVRRWEVDAAERDRQNTDRAAQGAAVGREITASDAAKEGILGARDVNREQDEVLYKYGHNASPFRRQPEPPPKFASTHVWGFMKWGKKAGAWGQGVDALEGRQQDRNRMKQTEHDGSKGNPDDKKD